MRGEIYLGNAVIAKRILGVHTRELGPFVDDRWKRNWKMWKSRKKRSFGDGKTRLRGQYQNSEYCA